MNGWQTWSTDVPLSMLDNFSGRKFLYIHGISTNLFIQGDYLRSILRYIIWRPYWFRLKQSMRKLDGLFFVSERGVDSRFDDLIIAKKLKINSYIAHNCIGDETMNFLELPPRSFDDRSGLISVGSYTWFKGHDFVLKAYAQSKYKNKIPLSIFGQKFTPYTDELRVLASNLGIHNTMIMFHEDISGDKLLRKYSDSSIFICGSHTECQPLVLLDAMATGTPFVSRASGCIPFMTGGISVRDIDSAAIAINELMDNPKMWRAFSMKGRNEIARNHHPNQLSVLLLKGISPIQKGVP
jgi:glycosyltransferase involved in cell wall biosynthesis